MSILQYFSESKSIKELNLSSIKKVKGFLSYQTQTGVISISD